MFLRDKNALPGLAALFVLGLFLVVHANIAPIESWDEARRGINALRMLQEGDYWNYRYLNDWDTFNTKPPLFTWLVALSFEWIGVSKFSLRLPSLLALLVYLVICYRFLVAWGNTRLASLTVAVLVLTKGIVGYHVALSGDTDMLFVSLLTWGMLGFFCFYKSGQRKYLVSIFVGFTLAFLTKGVAIVLVLPALVAFFWLKRKALPAIPWGVSLRWASVCVFVVLTVGLIFGRQTLYPQGYSNLLEAMFLLDGITRFTDQSLEVGYQWDYLVATLDIRFSPWIYFLYGGILFGLLKRRSRLFALFRKDDFLLFSLLVAGSVGLVLLFSQNKHQWYVAPMMLFLAYPVALILIWLWHRKVWGEKLVIAVFLVVGGMRIAPLVNILPDKNIISADQVIALSAKDTLRVAPRIPQDILFNLYSLNADLRIVEVAGKARQELRKEKCASSIDGYCLSLAEATAFPE